MTVAQNKSVRRKMRLRYRAGNSISLAEAVARERAKAARQQAVTKRKK